VSGLGVHVVIQLQVEWRALDVRVAVFLPPRVSCLGAVGLALSVTKSTANVAIACAYRGLLREVPRLAAVDDGLPGFGAQALALVAAF